MLIYFKKLWILLIIYLAYASKLIDNPTPDNNAFKHDDPMWWCLADLVLDEFNPISYDFQAEINTQTLSNQASFFYHKELSIESIAKQVCVDIRAKNYTLFNNPENSHFSVKNKQLELYPSKELSAISLIVEIDGIFRSSINNLIATDWETTFFTQAQKKISGFTQDLSRDDKNKIARYVDSLKFLHKLRIQSSGFLELKGGFCNEISNHVIYSMLRAFHHKKVASPSIAQIAVENHMQKYPISHVISVIDAAPRKQGEFIFDDKNPEHTKGYVCDPWLHQVNPFMPMAKITEHALLSPDNVPYKVIDTNEIGQFPDISSIPKELKSWLENWRLLFINTPYDIPADNKQIIQNVRRRLDTEKTSLSP